MRRNGWETSNSEVLISTPRRFGKTFSCVRRPFCPLTRVLIPSYLLGSIAIFCACLSLAFGLEVVVFSPARRASRKLLERIVEFVKLAGGEKRICEYNQARANVPVSHLAAADTRLRRAQEACRLNSFDGKKSLIRSFPSKVGVRAAAASNPA